MESEIKIEKGVKLPSPITRRVGLNLKYPLRDMGVGDSIFIPETKMANIYGSIQYIRLRFGGKFTCRTMDGGVRVWCLTPCKK